MMTPKLLHTIYTVCVYIALFGIAIFAILKQQSQDTYIESKPA